MSILEVSASLLSLIGVWLVAKEQIWCWPIGIVSVLLYAWIFYQSKLYSDSLLQILFAFLQIYGWINWKKATNKRGFITVRSINKKEIFAGVLFFFLTTMCLGWIMARFTNADFPIIDAACTATSLIAQFLISRKIIQNWLLWIIVDVFYVFIYLQKQLYTTALLYTLFVLIAIFGYQEWKKLMAQNRVTQ